MAADAMRKRARESADALNNAAGRYADVRDALRTYKPELRTARSETGLALRDAQDAAAAQRAAEGLPDPVNAQRDDDAPPLTDDDRQASANRSGKIDAAKQDLESARARAAAAMTALGTAADAAARKIRENWGSDGLTHSGWEAFLHRLNKFLKKLVEILMYIGMALAVLSILIPGLGILTLLSVVATVVSVAASFILAVQGEGSWLSVIIGVLSLGLIGVAAKMAGSLKLVQGAQLGSKVRFTPGALKELNSLAGRLAIYSRSTARPFDRFMAGRLGAQIKPYTSWGSFIQTTRVSPGWWQIGKPNAWVKGDFSRLNAWFRNDVSRFTTAVKGGPWRWDRLIGISDIKDVQKINAALSQLGITGFAIKPWMYIGPISYTFSWGMRPFSLLNPSNFNPADPRWSLYGWRDADYAGLYSDQVGL
nr:hypothetical protein GCM10025730_50750 [Promicromonospora thailandica]